MGERNKIILASLKSFSFNFLASQLLPKMDQINSLCTFEVRKVIVVLRLKLLSILVVLNLAEECPFESFSLIECSV